MNWQEQNDNKEASNPEPVEQDYSITSLINMFVKLIIFSLESFEDKEKK